MDEQKTKREEVALWHAGKIKTVKGIKISDLQALVDALYMKRDALDGDFVLVDFIDTLTVFLMAERCDKCGQCVKAGPS
jgi:hypothetical protein